MTLGTTTDNRSSSQRPLRIAMLGLRGLRPDREISGFETAFSEIAPRLVKMGHDVTIFCRHAAYSPERRAAVEDGVKLVHLPSPGGKNLSAVASTGLAVLHVLARSRYDVIFFVNVGMGHHAHLAGLRGVPVVMNVDGLDWTRAKWGRFAQRYFLSAAKAAVRYVDRVVTDAEAMRQYYRTTFGRDSDMIAYGADITTSVAPQLIEPLGLTPRGYNLVVSRLIPENTLEEILTGYSRSRSTRRLVVVGGATYQSPFHQRLTEIAAADPRITLIGQLADQTLLQELWCNCFAYFHGHSVGGTNPALLRAMGAGSAVLARDTEFNREVLGETGLYFQPTAESVASAIDQLEADEPRADRLRGLARERVAREYTWEKIAAEYDRCFRKAAQGERT